MIFIIIGFVLLAIVGYLVYEFLLKSKEPDVLTTTIIPLSRLKTNITTTTMIPTTIMTPTTIMIPTTTIIPTTTPASTTTLSPYLYQFKSHKFTSAKKNGRFGPTLDEIRIEYSTVNWAQTNEFLNMTTQGIQEWKVPASGEYIIRAVGAGVPYNNNYTNNGMNQYQKGMDATIITILRKDEVIKILVGQMPNNFQATGGAGGTFVIRDTQTPILIAGGGGGRGYQQADIQSNATISNSGQNATNGGLGGIDGNGGKIGTSAQSGAGGGLIRSGMSAAFGGATGGFSFGGSGIGGVSISGFGGGGGCLNVEFTGGGGGGGYSGGGAGSSIGLLTSGGGGGSYSITNSFISAVANNNNNGFVEITANF